MVQQSLLKGHQWVNILLNFDVYKGEYFRLRKAINKITNLTTIKNKLYIFFDWIFSILRAVEKKKCLLELIIWKRHKHEFLLFPLIQICCEIYKYLICLAFFEFKMPTASCISFALMIFVFDSLSVLEAIGKSRWSYFDKVMSFMKICYT